MSSGNQKENKESITTIRMRGFFDGLIDLQIKKSEGYGESWKAGRPIGMTDNLLWIATRIQNNEKRLHSLYIEEEYYIDAIQTVQDSIERRINKVKEEITDDLKDLAVFTAFRYFMHLDKVDLI